MPNIAAFLKAEISRVARKELRPQVDAWKKQTTSLRSEIASLKRRVQTLERQLKAFSREANRRSEASSSPSQVQVAEDGHSTLRFRAAGMASNRKRLGLSAADFGRLIGATAQSVYAWEQGKSKPQAKNLAAIAALRGIGKRDVEARLQARSTSDH
jgi:DNA-binding transcriptional regulator YiaG